MREDDVSEQSEDEEDPIELMESLLSSDGAGGPLPPMAPDGGFAPSIAAEPAPIPEASIETSICLCGPCRHYIEMVSWFPSGNTEGSPGYDARELVRYCDRLRSAHISLSEELVFTCNAWDPIDEQEVEKRAKLQDKLTQIRAQHKGVKENG